MKKYLCLGCGFSYDEARGLPEHGIAPGTRWADIPDDWVCPGLRHAQVGLRDGRDSLLEPGMSVSFVLRAGERGFSRLVSTGPNATYVAGHPDGVITRHSSFNFHEYQSGIAGFGRIRVFGDEVFSPGGTGYNMHPHHNFIIAAFVLGGALTHVNTIGKVDELRAGDFYVFSAGSGGKHAELNIGQEDLAGHLSLGAAKPASGAAVLPARPFRRARPTPTGQPA